MVEQPVDRGGGECFRHELVEAIRGWHMFRKQDSAFHLAIRVLACPRGSSRWDYSKLVDFRTFRMPLGPDTSWDPGDLTLHLCS
jgi:hypothetical protein